MTRDTWMHRSDLAAATGRPMTLTADHDGRLVADVAAEWARRHGRPFELHLTGAAGGRYRQGQGGEVISLDAVEFCRILAERGSRGGLLAVAGNASEPFAGSVPPARTQGCLDPNLARVGRVTVRWCGRRGQASG